MCTDEYVIYASFTYCPGLNILTLADYCASKAGAIALNDALRYELDHRYALPFLVLGDTLTESVSISGTTAPRSGLPLSARASSRPPCSRPSTYLDPGSGDSSSLSSSQSPLSSGSLLLWMNSIRRRSTSLSTPTLHHSLTCFQASSEISLSGSVKLVLLSSLTPG
jgi:hypothetical protein